MSWQDYVSVVLLWPLIGLQKHVRFQRKIVELHLRGFLLVVVVLLVDVQFRDQLIQAMRNSDPRVRIAFLCSYIQF